MAVITDAEFALIKWDDVYTNAQGVADMSDMMVCGSSWKRCSVSHVGLLELGGPYLLTL